MTAWITQKNRGNYAAHGNVQRGPGSVLTVNVSMSVLFAMGLTPAMMEVMNQTHCVPRGSVLRINGNVAPTSVLTSSTSVMDTLNVQTFRMRIRYSATSGTALKVYNISCCPPSLSCLSFTLHRSAIDSLYKRFPENTLFPICQPPQQC